MPSIVQVASHRFQVPGGRVFVDVTIVPDGPEAMLTPGGFHAIVAADAQYLASNIGFAHDREAHPNKRVRKYVEAVDLDCPERTIEEA